MQKNLNELLYVITPQSLQTRTCFGLILRNRTVHTVIIVLELHVDYIPKMVYELTS